MKHHTKLTTQEQEQLAEVKSQQATAREFASVEEALRTDAAQTVVPPGIAQRLQQSTEALPKPKSAWWKRVIGGTNS